VIHPSHTLRITRVSEFVVHAVSLVLIKCGAHKLQESVQSGHQIEAYCIREMLLSHDFTINLHLLMKLEK